MEAGRHCSSYSGSLVVNLKEGDKQLERSMCVWEGLNITVKLCVNKCFMTRMLIELCCVPLRDVGL